MSLSGQGKFFKNDEGRGFIRQGAGTSDLFVHRSGCPDNLPREGDTVTLDVGDRNGLPQARNVGGGTGQPNACGVRGGGGKGGRGGKGAKGGRGGRGGRSGKPRLDVRGVGGAGPAMGSAEGGPGPGTRLGVVKFYHGAKGFGFIGQGDGAPDMFVHRNSVAGGPLQEGDRVRYEVGADERTGKQCAVNVVGGTGADLGCKGGVRGNSSNGRGKGGGKGDTASFAGGGHGGGMGTSGPAGGGFGPTRKLGGEGQGDVAGGVFGRIPDPYVGEPEPGLYGCSPVPCSAPRGGLGPAAAPGPCRGGPPDPYGPPYGGAPGPYGCGAAGPYGLPYGDAPGPYRGHPLDPYGPPCSALSPYRGAPPDAYDAPYSSAPGPCRGQPPDPFGPPFGDAPVHYREAPRDPYSPPQADVPSSCRGGAPDLFDPPCSDALGPCRGSLPELYGQPRCGNSLDPYFCAALDPSGPPPVGVGGSVGPPPPFGSTRVPYDFDGGGCLGKGRNF